HHLAAAGEEVLVLSRSGGPPDWRLPPGDLPGTVRSAAVDATDAAALSRLATGATALYSCVNPAYHRWPTDWPPLMAGMLDAAETTGAVLVSAGNLYSYPRGTRPMTERSPDTATTRKGQVRARLWTTLRERHEAGRVRATEVRASDYLGPEADQHAHAGPRMLEPLLVGKPLRPLGSADAPHTWTYLPDLARAMAAAATTPDAWGRIWHAPSPEPLTYRRLSERFAQAAGSPPPRIRPLRVGMLRLAGLVAPMVRELVEVAYQQTEPFVMDSERSST